MNKIISIILMINIFGIQLFAQQKKDSCCILEKDFLGTWQRNDSVVGSGLNQNFKFLKGNLFVFNIGNEGDDMRNIIQLKGKYRLVKDVLYFTIISRTIIDGPIEIPDPGISLNIFSIGGKKLKEVREPIIKELPDPCYITVLSNKKIKINQEVYFKVNSQ